MILNFNDILLKHNKCIVNSRSECDTSAQLGNHTFTVPVVMANMKSLMTRETCQIFDNENWFYIYHRIDGVLDVREFVKYAEENLKTVSVSIGVKPEWIQFIKDCKKYNRRIDYFTLDIALSYTDNIIPIIKAVKDNYPDSYLIVGNGATKEWSQWLSSFKEVDCIKVGIGVSQACRTRQYTGFGSSTAGSLIEVAQHISKSTKIMSDGGITIQDKVVCVGDVNKALVLGADWVMSGALFSRCIDSPALKEGYYGNASKYAKQHSNHVEGELIRTESNGLTIKEMMKLIQDSIKSGISYSGGQNIADMKNLTKYEINGLN